MTAITRSASHQYTYQGVTYPGVTGILKVLDKSDALMWWAARNTAEAALNLLGDDGAQAVATTPLGMLVGTTGQAGAIKALTSRSSWKRDEAAQLGSRVHDIADKLVQGMDTGWLDPLTLQYVERYRSWWEASGWTLRLSEAFLVNPTIGYGGTFDLLARDRDGKTVLADIKTGKGIYHEAVLQLAAYGMADLIQFGDTMYPMPQIDRYVILHVTADKMREVELNVGQAEREAFLACVSLARWRESMKGKRL